MCLFFLVWVELEFKFPFSVAESRNGLGGSLFPNKELSVYHMLC